MPTWPPASNYLNPRKPDPPSVKLCEVTSKPPAKDSGPDSAVVSNTVFLAGEERLSDSDFQALAPQSGGWSRASAEAMSDAVIVMIDDEELNIEMTEAFLAEAGYRRFLWTSDSRNAITLIRQSRPGVVLLDLTMPHVSGMEILEALRADAGLRHVPVIVLTANTSPEVKLRALSSGAMDFLNKPVDPSELGLRIRNTLAASAYREHLASHDLLTGVSNKSRLLQDMAPVLALARSGGHSGALLQVGIDRLSAINDALGRAVGDQVVQRMARRLGQCVETEVDGELCAGAHAPMLYRLDGDEFAILVPFTDTGDGFAAFVSRVMEACSFALARGGRDLFITASVGIAVFPQDGDSADTLITNAGLALRQAKESGRNTYEFFSSRFNRRAARQLAAGAQLRQAIGRDEVELVYRPVFEAGGRLSGAEALLRWRRPGAEVIAEQALMTLAASVDMASALTEWALEQVASDTRRWAGAGLTGVTVAVPVTLGPVRLEDLTAPDRGLLHVGTRSGKLCLLLEQTPALDDLTPTHLQQLAELRKAGIRLALGRFGQGASSLQVLRRLPWDEVRLDGHLLPVPGDAGASWLLRGTIALVKSLGLQAVACGVADKAQVALLHAEGVNLYQGDFFGQPVSGAGFALKWLTARNPAR